MIDKVDMEKLEEMGGDLFWVITSCFGEDETRGPAILGICGNDERDVSIRIQDLIVGSEPYLQQTPKDAEWLAEDLRTIADYLDTIAAKGTRCEDCKELYNPDVTDCCNQI